MNTFTEQDLWNLRIAASEMRLKWQDSYYESLDGKSGSTDAIKGIWEEYSSLYYRLVQMTSSGND